ncbi:hypothetical protein MAR_007395 [Mya arenaria]|uniref:Uncharacterized protein n=1 Tax=Mya arenaria TaxID=6604 RepID=A0ABY7DES3_MYAAR|nr:hypothetical protein MAR_007395 [Mya arenaria]
MLYLMKDTFDETNMKLCENPLKDFLICYFIFTWIGGKCFAMSHYGVEFTNEFFFRIDVSVSEEVTAGLKGHHFYFQSQVVDDIFIFTYEKDTEKVFTEAELQFLKQSFHGMVKDIQQCRTMHDFEFFKPPDASKADSKTKAKRDVTAQDQKFEEEPYWDEGEGIDESWKSGITGEGITNKELTFNFVTNDVDVSAVLFHSYIGETFHKTK